MRAEQGNADGDDLSSILRGSAGVTLQTAQQQQQRLLLSSSSNDEDLIPNLLVSGPQAAGRTELVDIYYWKNSTLASGRRGTTPAPGW